MKDEAKTQEVRSYPSSVDRFWKTDQMDERLDGWKLAAENNLEG